MKQLTKKRSKIGDDGIDIIGRQSPHKQPQVYQIIFPNVLFRKRFPDIMNAKIEA
jgi:hypothetical protein